MGVRASLVAIYNPDSNPVVDTMAAATLAQAPDDVRGNLQVVEAELAVMIQKLTRIQAVATAAGDTTTANAIGTQITALS